MAIRAPGLGVVTPERAITPCFRLGERVSSDFGPGLEIAAVLEPEFHETVRQIQDRNRVEANA